MATPITPMRLTDEDKANARAIITRGDAVDLTSAVRVALEREAKRVTRARPRRPKRGASPKAPR